MSVKYISYSGACVYSLCVMCSCRFRFPSILIIYQTICVMTICELSWLCILCRKLSGHLIVVELTQTCCVAWSTSVWFGSTSVLLVCQLALFILYGLSSVNYILWCINLSVPTANLFVVEVLKPPIVNRKLLICTYVFVYGCILWYWIKCIDSIHSSILCNWQ